jgi:hypothetical protein
MNVVLLAPVWMQITHLLIADSLWIVLILLLAEVSAFGAAGLTSRAHQNRIGSARQGAAARAN